MKILHICLASFYIDDYSYQENILPIYHKKNGHDVTIVASKVSFDTNGQPCFLPKASTYNTKEGIRICRLNYRWFGDRLGSIFRIYIGFNAVLCEVKPDVVFVHGCQFLDIFHILRYKQKNSNVRIYVDNHADFSNSARGFLSKNILHKIIWKYCAKSIEPYTEKFYGVLPARVDFLKNVYGINPKKIEYLPMGADDVLVKAATEGRVEFRLKHDIHPSDFLIVTGGKIDSAKTETLSLMRAVKHIRQTHSHVRLLIFGSVVPELRLEFDSLLQENLIDYIGWIDAQESYKYFAAADLVVFPGRHSVFWEQVVAQGVPLVAKYWSGTDHVEIGGNCKFLYKSDENELIDILTECIGSESIYREMLRCAQQNARQTFLYSEIAQNSIHH